MRYVKGTFFKLFFEMTGNRLLDRRPSFRKRFSFASKPTTIAGKVGGKVSSFWAKVNKSKAMKNKKNADTDCSSSESNAPIDGLPPESTDCVGYASCEMFKLCCYEDTSITVATVDDVEMGNTNQQGTTPLDISDNVGTELTSGILDTNEQIKHEQYYGTERRKTIDVESCQYSAQSTEKEKVSKPVQWVHISDCPPKERAKHLFSALRRRRKTFKAHNSLCRVNSFVMVRPHWTQNNGRRPTLRSIASTNTGLKKSMVAESLFDSSSHGSSTISDHLVAITPKVKVNIGTSFLKRMADDSSGEWDYGSYDSSQSPSLLINIFNEYDDFDEDSLSSEPFSFFAFCAR